MLFKFVKSALKFYFVLSTITVFILARPFLNFRAVFSLTKSTVCLHLLSYILL